MTNEMIAILVFLVSFLVSMLVYPRALRFAKKHDIVDNPNARKLQRVPVPVFGGVVVFTGILVGWLVLALFMKSEVLSWGLAAMSVMLLIGIWDDMKDISALLRLVIEIVLLVAFIALTGIYVDDLHGLWGIHELEPWVGISLSVFAGLGAINAVNMIDGVDGYSSGYGMLSSACVALAFWHVWNPVVICLAVIVIGAILPFFLHNVFGAKSKMFIGDSGTLMLGMLLVVMALYSLSSKNNLVKLEERGMCVTAFVVAVGCIPLFDTVRVMTMRILRGKSPFHPDKTHLHHLFIDMGFSHLGAALTILSMNIGIVLLWLLSWQLGASMDVQMYVVALLGMLMTFGFYKLMKTQQNSGPVDEEGYPQGTRLWHIMLKVGEMTHREKTRFWRVTRYLMDGPFMGG